MAANAKPTYVVEVDEVRVLATRGGSDWWIDYRRINDRSGRIVSVVVSLGGEVCHVKCDNKEHADWLARYMVDSGMVPTAVRVIREKATTKATEGATT